MKIEIIFLFIFNFKVCYIDEEGVSEIVSVEICLFFVLKDNVKKYVEVEMYFGFFEVVVYIIDFISGNCERCIFWFFFSY